MPNTLAYFTTALMRLCHPPDGSTSPKYKLLCFITTKKICKEKNALAFNQDRCCHLVLCLRLIPLILEIMSQTFKRTTNKKFYKMDNFFREKPNLKRPIYILYFIFSILSRSLIKINLKIEKIQQSIKVEEG